MRRRLREEVERVSKESHHWKNYNVDQLVRDEGVRVRGGRCGVLGVK